MTISTPCGITALTSLVVIIESHVQKSNDYVSLICKIAEV